MSSVEPPPPPYELEQPAVMELAKLLVEKGDSVTALPLRSETGVPSLDIVRQHRAGILAAANRNSVGEVKVTGQVAWGDHVEAASLDLVVDPPVGGQQGNLKAFEAEVRALVGCPVHVVTAADAEGPLGAVMSDNAIPL